MKARLLLRALVLLGPISGSAEEPGVCLVQAARAQIGVTVSYDPGYRRISYPLGDVPLDRGVCSDVIIRAYRAFGVDLQVLLLRDRTYAWGAYPNPWRTRSPDRNIDHRRVPNLATYFRRHGVVVAERKDPKAFLPGDVVTWDLASGVPHIGIVSDQRNPSGVPFVVHNIGHGAQEEDVLFAYRLTGHFRYFPDRRILCGPGSLATPGTGP
jgi:uncharacterized protein